MKAKGPKHLFRPFKEKLAATYSRGVYKTTTIGKTVFDGRVRNGNGSDHSFMATKKSSVMCDRSRRASAQQLPITYHTKFKERTTGIIDHRSPFGVL